LPPNFWRKRNGQGEASRVGRGAQGSLAQTPKRLKPRSKTPNTNLAVRREKVTVGAAGGVGKMLFAIGVAAQACLAGGAGGIAVARVAELASLVLRLRMETWQLTRLVATAARGRLGDAARTVRAVTRQAAGRNVAVRASILVSVAGSARLLGGRARVRLVAARAGLMPFGRALLLCFVTSLAALRL